MPLRPNRQSQYGGRGFGLLEIAYEKSLLMELRKANLDVDSQKRITVYYENEIVGEFIADSAPRAHFV